MDRKRLSQIPDHPGVYLMKDTGGRVIYVGKANSLKKRVRSYFGRKHDSPRTRVLVEKVEEIDTILVDSEVEALILELNLIKEHRPRYNIRLKDDKRYPFIRITTDEKYPRVLSTRQVENDGTLYFGPYTDGRAMHRVLQLIRSVFPLRSCSHVLPSQRGVRVCLDYQIGKCLGPCEERISVEEYGRMVDRVVLLLKGKNEALVKDLKREMKDASAEKLYEKAALLRDQIASIRRVTERQRITSTDSVDRDVVALSTGEGEEVAVLLRVREGKMNGREVFSLKSGAEEDPFGSFLKRIYSGSAFIPDEILCDRAPRDREVIREWLSTQKGRSVRLHVPVRGEKKKLVNLAGANAEHERKAALLRKLARKDRSITALRQLKRELGLTVLPRRIECFDVSNLGDRDLVGSSVSFLDGLPEKERYRRYKIRTVTGIDDFASMGEIVGRRFRRLLTDGESLPDLVVVDGGKGQISSAMTALRNEGAEDVFVIGLAKKREEIFRPGLRDPIVLKEGPALHLLQRIRDEAHRFAITYQRKRRKKGITRSLLDTIPGLGREKKERLLKKFRSVQGVRRAGIEGVQQVSGIGPVLAARIVEHLEKDGAK